MCENHLREQATNNQRIINSSNCGKRPEIPVLVNTREWHLHIPWMGVYFHSQNVMTMAKTINTMFLLCTFACLCLGNEALQFCHHPENIVLKQWHRAEYHYGSVVSSLVSAVSCASLGRRASFVFVVTVEKEAFCRPGNVVICSHILLLWCYGVMVT